MSIHSIDDIKNVFYINLAHRTDRKAHVEEQLASIGLLSVAQRFNAIETTNGAIGCSMSHLKILETAKQNALDHVLIVEDDITFLDPELFKRQINRFFELHGDDDWRVVLFAGNTMPPVKEIDDTCVEVLHSQTTTAYLVNGHYIGILANNVRMGLSHLISKPHLGTHFAIDKYWIALQRIGKWYLIIPLSVIQKEGDYSNIEMRNVNYKSLMLDLNKEALFDAIKKRQFQVS